MNLGPAMRALAYGLAGSAVEAAFTTTVASAEAGALRPHGPSTVLMVPLYALAMPLFEPLHARVARRGMPVRGAIYAAGILAVEAVTGLVLRRATGRCPWDYSGRSRFAVGGVIRLDYAPLWALAGLGAERIHSGLTRP